MKKYINPDSDGNFYQLNDLVLADCNDCEDCSQCCKDMGDSILLDPYDLYQIQKYGQVTFDHLVIHGFVALTLRDGIILPHLKMTEDDACCPFLNEAGRCSIHEYRPGMCRLFPLGRDFQGEDLEYILLEKACANKNRRKVTVSDWIGVEAAEAYHAFVRDWHMFRRQMAEVLVNAGEQQAKELSLRLMHNFYVSGYDTAKEFYPQYEVLVGRYRRAFAGMYTESDLFTL